MTILYYYASVNSVLTETIKNVKKWAAATQEPLRSFDNSIL